MKKTLLFLLALALFITPCTALAESVQPTLPPNPDEEAQPAASVDITTSGDAESTTALTSGIRLWIGLNGNLYAKNITRGAMKHVWVHFSVDGTSDPADSGSDWAPLRDEFSLYAGQTKVVKTAEQISDYMKEGNLTSIRFLSRQSASEAGTDYVATSEIVTYEPLAAVTYSAHTPVFKSNSTTSPRLFTLQKGARLMILSWRDGWARVYSNYGTGYARIRCLALTEGIPAEVTTDTYTYATADANARKAAIAAGTEVALVGQDGGYYLVRNAAGAYAYIQKKMLAPAEESAPILPDETETAPDDVTEADEMEAEEADPLPPEEPAVTQAAPEPTAEADVLHYEDAAADVALDISLPGWNFQKDEENDQVYFFSDNATPNDVILLQSVASGGADFSQLYQQTWETIQSSLVQASCVITNLTEQNALIGMGSEYTCHIYNMNVSLNGQESINTYAFWYTDTRFYICVLSSTTENYDAQSEAFEDILSSFRPLS